MQKDITSLKEQYDANCDVIVGPYPNFNYIDLELLLLIEKLNERVNKLEEQLKKGEK